jgi:hypothetical protein
MRIVAVTLLAACTATSAPEVDPTPTPPAPATAPEPWLASARGGFYTRTNLSITAKGPNTTLLAYASAPGATLVGAAGAVEALPMDATQLSIWYDTALKQNGTALLDAYGYGEVLTQLPDEAILESELAIDGPAVQHQLTAIYFDVTNLGDRFALDGVVDTTATYAPSSTGGQLTLAAHDLAIPIGDLAYQLADSRGSMTMRQMLGELTACPLVALAVANECGDCAAYVPAFDALCETGLDQVFADTRAEMATVQLHLTGGTAALSDTNGDRRADHLDGAWTTSAQPLVAFHARLPPQAPEPASVQ